MDSETKRVVITGLFTLFGGLAGVGGIRWYNAIQSSRHKKRLLFREDLDRQIKELREEVAALKAELKEKDAEYRQRERQLIDELIRLTGKASRSEAQVELMKLQLYRKIGLEPEEKKPPGEGA